MQEVCWWADNASINLKLAVPFSPLCPSSLRQPAAMFPDHHSPQHHHHHHLHQCFWQSFCWATKRHQVRTEVLYFPYTVTLIYKSLASLTLHTLPTVCIFSIPFLYISYSADKENMINNQEASLIGDHFLHSPDRKCLTQEW